MVTPIDLEAVLDKILNLKSVKDDIAERKEGEAFQKTPWTLHIRSAIEDFFEQDIATIGEQVPEIWAWLKEEIRNHFKWLTSDLKTFDDEGVYFKPEEWANKSLDQLRGDLLITLNRRERVE